MILGVDESASTSDIKKAFRRLALEHHPDKGGDREKFMEIHRAYEALKDRPETMTITQEFVYEGPPERAYVFEGQRMTGRNLSDGPDILCASKT